MPPREDGLTLFVNAQVFDGSGRPLFPGQVLVRGDRSAAVAEGSERLSRDDASVVDCAGGTLMPDKAAKGAKAANGRLLSYARLNTLGWYYVVEAEPEAVLEQVP